MGSRELVQMNELENRNRKIIDAVIRKERAVCPGAVALIGTYEEMFSNWHGKTAQAAERGDRHLAFMSLKA